VSPHGAAPHARSRDGLAVAPAARAGAAESAHIGLFFENCGKGKFLLLKALSTGPFVLGTDLDI
jgi:hypothetical protein